MSTRSTIGIINRDGSVESVYCHWDGYPECPGAGATLLEHYSNEDKVRGLLSWGNISSLCERITPSANSGHSYDKPEEGVTVFYGRDRNEKGQGAIAIKQKNVAALQSVFKESWCDYLYLWDCKTNTWLYGNAQYPDKMYILTRKRCKLKPLPGTHKLDPLPKVKTCVALGRDANLPKKKFVSISLPKGLNSYFGCDVTCGHLPPSENLILESKNIVMDDEDAYNVEKEERAGYVAALAQRIAALRQYVDAETNDISRILLKLS